MNKKSALLAVLLLAGAAFVFANGSQEQGTNNATGTYGETLTLTGKVKLQANDFPILTTAKGDYELMYPRVYNGNVTIKDGDTITVTGVTTPGPRWEQSANANANLKFLMVQKATIGGKDYAIPYGSGRRGMMDDGRYGPGMMGGNGGRGMMGGRW